MFTIIAIIALLVAIRNLTAAGAVGRAVLTRTTDRLETEVWDRATRAVLSPVGIIVTVKVIAVIAIVVLNRVFDIIDIIRLMF